MRRILALAAASAAMITLLVPVSQASAAAYTVPRSAGAGGTASTQDFAVALARQNARNRVLAVGVDCIDWNYRTVMVERGAGPNTYIAVVEAKALCVS
ncbi:hypothetical protein GCM10022243_20180 [Saccharothrix violaceirubra]|uniref:Uncharacterized protein n=1 Tax=Saccharothrix violaceirubra TaxID=413306 RepID=A0A7W7T1Y9_9PSEU|nr:hypothetical protein [Saccharothrix violaceirubra]MBB4965078.1 hypothetical protein [Saccharothrix violaceirubra]